jgi:chromosome segregation ATPase
MAAFTQSNGGPSTTRTRNPQSGSPLTRGARRIATRRSSRRKEAHYCREINDSRRDLSVTSAGTGNLDSHTRSEPLARHITRATRNLASQSRNVAALTCRLDALSRNASALSDHTKVLTGDIEAPKHNAETLTRHIGALKSDVDAMSRGRGALKNNADAPKCNVYAIANNVFALKLDVETLTDNVFAKPQDHNGLLFSSLHLSMNRVAQASRQ